jgi:hypothetical protein
MTVTYLRSARPGRHPSRMMAAPNYLMRDKYSPHAFTVAQMGHHDTQDSADHAGGPGPDLPHSYPSNLIGANGFAGQEHCSRVCAAEQRRAAGAPLTVIVSGKRILGTVGRVTRTDRLSAVPETA